MIFVKDCILCFRLPHTLCLNRQQLIFKNDPDVTSVLQILQLWFTERNCANRKCRERFARY